MRLPAAVALLCLPLAAQHHGDPAPAGTSTRTAQHAGADGGQGHREPSTGTGSSTEHGKTPERAVHRAAPELTAAAALQALRDGNARVAAARARGEDAKEPGDRPGGAGRYVVAVIGCADCPVDPATLFGLRREDVLWISNAGATATSDAAALVAWAAREHRLRLCVVLPHTDCPSLAPASERTSRVEGAELRAAAATALAARRHLAIAHAQALLQAEQLRAALRSAPQPASDAKPANETVRVVAASVDASTRAVTFHVPRADELPIAPIR